MNKHAGSNGKHRRDQIPDNCPGGRSTLRRSQLCTREEPFRQTTPSYSTGECKTRSCFRPQDPPCTSFSQPQSSHSGQSSLPSAPSHPSLPPPLAPPSAPNPLICRERAVTPASQNTRTEYASFSPAQILRRARRPRGPHRPHSRPLPPLDPASPPLLSSSHASAHPQRRTPPSSPPPTPPIPASSIPSTHHHHLRRWQEKHSYHHQWSPGESV